jgi:hypothetical protein
MNVKKHRSRGHAAAAEQRDEVATTDVIAM